MSELPSQPNQPKKAASRNRAPNFSKQEHEFLAQVLEPFKKVIECKKTDQVKHSQKQDAWREATEMFNANTTHVARTMDNLIYCYRNIKSKIKKERSESKMVLEGRYCLINGFRFRYIHMH